MQVVENVALISINATLLVQLISFLAFMALFNRFMIRPLRKVMSERENYMVDVHQKIADIDHSYQELSRQIVDQENETRKAASVIRDEIEASALSTVNDLINKTRKEIAGLKASAQKDTDAKIVEARQKVASEAEGLADQIIRALLERRSLS